MPGAVKDAASITPKIKEWDCIAVTIIRVGNGPLA